METEADLPPIYSKVPKLLRKKKVEHFIPNTFRVFGERAERQTGRPWEEWKRRWRPPPLLQDINEPLAKVPYVDKEHVHNQPHPKTCRFIRTNVYSLHEPVCQVDTIQNTGIMSQPTWWPLPSQAAGAHTARWSYPPSSVMRSDYAMNNRSTPKGQTRFGYHPRRAALGIVPVNELWEPNGFRRYWKEGISFEHQYNSRMDPNYPIRGKRHGGFVYDQIEGRIDKYSQTEIVKSANTLKAAEDPSVLNKPPRCASSEPTILRPEPPIKFPESVYQQHAPKEDEPDCQETLERAVEKRHISPIATYLNNRGD